MNAALLLMSSALVAGDHPQAGHPAPPVVATGSACHGGCGPIHDACCQPCCEEERRGLLARLRDLCGGRKRDECCEPAPVCCEAPKPVCCPPPKPVCCPQPKPVCCEAPQPHCDCGVSTCAEPCCEEERRGLLARLRGLFGGRKKGGECCDTWGAADCCDPCHGGAVHPHPHPQPYPHAVPTPPGGAEKIAPPKEMPKDKATPISGIDAYPQVTPVAVPKTGLPLGGTPNPFEPARRHEEGVRHAPDYSELTGLLSFVHADGGYWVVRYAPLAEEDLHGGSVALARDTDMSGFREGDLVAVEGTILRAKTSHYLPAPLYRADSIRLVQRAQE